MFPTESAISNKADDTAAEENVRQGGQPQGALPGSPAEPAAPPRSRWKELATILVSLEVGIFLFVAPWSRLWSGNLLLEYVPAWRPFFMSTFVRGACSGLGLLNLWFAFYGVWKFRDARSAVEPE